MQKLIAALVLCGMFIGFMTGCRSTKKIQKVIATTAIPRDTTGDAARAAAVVGHGVIGRAHV